MTCTKRK